MTTTRRRKLRASTAASAVHRRSKSPAPRRGSVRVSERNVSESSAAATAFVVNGGRFVVDTSDKSARAQGVAQAAGRGSLRARAAGVTGVGDQYSQRGGLRTLHSAVRALFLPVGYPDSVSSDYLAYQIWDTVQAACSYLRGVLSMTALMEGAGVGRDAATPLGAALQWVLRDGAGMLGGLGFATVCATRFDANVKGWRLFADAINNIGLTLDLVAPMYPARFAEIAALAAVCKSMCGVAAGATKAALTHHFALRGNLADVQAKEGSQETAVTLLGLAVGAWFARFADGSTSYIWCAFLVLTALHFAANWRAVRGLCLPTVNAERAAMLAHDHLDLQINAEVVMVEDYSASEEEDTGDDADNGGGGGGGGVSPIEDAHEHDACWSIDDVSRREAIVGPLLGFGQRHPALRYGEFGRWIRVEVGVSWMRAFGGDDGAERWEAVREHREEVVRAYGTSASLPEAFAGERFVVTSFGDDASTGRAPPRVVAAVLADGATPRDELLATYHAHAAARTLAHPLEQEFDNFGEMRQLAINEAYLLHRAAARRWVDLLERKGWQVERGLLGAGPYRYSWVAEG